jgi:LysM repeat protein
LALQYEVKRGDSLWNLAGRHLGDSDRWPELLNFHNDLADKYGTTSSRVFRIIDPNKIFVEQILYLPVRGKQLSRPATEKGTKNQAGQIAIPINLKIDYTFGHDVPPIIYTQETPEGTIKTEMRGKISIELIAPRRYRHNLELLLAKDETHCRQKLNEVYIPAFSALTAFPDIALEGNSVIITPQGPAKAALPSYKIPLAEKSRKKMHGNLKVQKNDKGIKVEGKQYKFSHDIEIIVNVHLKADRAKGQSNQEFGGFFSNLKRDLKGAGNALIDHFGNKENWREIGRAFGDAGKISLIAHGGSALKAYLMFDVATGGVITTTAMVFSGTPAGQKIITEFIPSMNPGTLPSLTHYGVAGYLTGTTIETIAKKN